LIGISILNKLTADRVVGMQQTACHILTTAEVKSLKAALTTTIPSTASVLSHIGQSKVLHLLGPPWTRAFRCVWMLEEINQEYYQYHNSNNNKNLHDTTVPSTGRTSSSLHNHRIQQPQQQIPYYLVHNASPLSKYVKRYHSTGKVPILLEYSNYHHNHKDDANDDETDNETIATNDVALDDENVFVLSESSAINTYLYDQYGLYTTASSSSSNTRSINDSSSGLVPPIGSSLRGQYDALVSCICTELDAQGLWMHRKHDVMSFELTSQRPNYRAILHAKDHFKRINTYLAYQCNPYLLGSHFTAVDILYMHCLEWSHSIGWSTDTWPTVHVEPPITIETIKEQRKHIPNNHDKIDNHNKDVAFTSTNNFLSELPPSTLQPYIELCRSRPAYLRSIEIRNECNTKRKNKHQTTNQITETIHPSSKL
jgi:glutathione S-transferase